MSGVLVGRRYRLSLTADQIDLAERTAAACRFVWNLCLDQRLAAHEVGARRPTYTDQAHEVAALKVDLPWLREPPSQTLQQTLLDLDRACRTHHVHKVHFRKRRTWQPSFRFPDPKQIRVLRLAKHWGRVVLPKFGACRFRWSRELGGDVRNVTIRQDAGNWYVSFCVDDGRQSTPPNRLPEVGIDRGVTVAVATSDGVFYDRTFKTSGEKRQLVRLQRRMSRQRRGSCRRSATRRKISRLRLRERRRRQDFVQQTAHGLASKHGLVVLEDLRVRNMTASARGTLEVPGRHVRQKAGLNRAILDKGWGQLRLALLSQGRDHGCEVLVVPAAYTSQTCSACGYVAARSRESQARFCCVACGFESHADVNAARVILAAGQAVTGRGGLATGQPMNRQPPDTPQLFCCSSERGSSGSGRGVDVKRPVRV
jgi:IS605 OrfB family transposase